jgi:hypothetical protein
MDVLIHTSGRASLSAQHTLRALNADGINPVLVVQERDASDYQRMGFRTHVLPEHIHTLAPTRDYIIHDMPGDDHVVFMDDDLVLATRRADDPTKFRQPEDGHLRAMLAAIDWELRVHPMVGIGAREGGNRVTEPILHNTRIMRVLAFRRSYLRKRMMTFSPMVVMEDFHINLQILRSGAQTCVCNQWVSNQVNGSDALGGCSVYRTPAVQAEAARMLAARHPGLVRIVRKQTINGWGAEEDGMRTDVVISWKKAYESSLGNK